MDYDLRFSHLNVALIHVANLYANLAPLVGGVALNKKSKHGEKRVILVIYSFYFLL